MSASASAASSAGGVSWSRVIPTPRAASASDLDSLAARFGVTLPAALKSLLLTEDRGGFQVSPSAFLAQNVQTAAWKRERIGPLYPVVPPAEDSEDSEEGGYPHLALVNESFLDELLQQDDDVEEPAVSRKKARQSPAAAAEATAAAAAQHANNKRARVPFFAFAETVSGLLVVLDTRAGCVMLLDVTGKKGPWVAGENFDDFWSRLTTGGEKSAAAGEEEVEEEDEAEDDADFDGEHDEDEEGDLFCCDACMDELPASTARFHCNQCENYDLCAACMMQLEAKRKQQSSKAAASASAASAGGVKRPAADGGHSHPASHTFTRIEGGAAAAQEEEEEEKE